MDTLYLNQVAIHYGQAQHCKSTILQHITSIMLKKNKQKQRLLYSL